MTLTLQNLPGQVVPPLISASDLKNKLRETLKLVDKNQSGVVLTKRGTPTAAVMSFQEYQEYLKLKEQQRRQEVLAKFRKLREGIQERTGGLPEQEAMALANRFQKEVIQEMIDEDKISYEQS